MATWTLTGSLENVQKPSLDTTVGVEGDSSTKVTTTSPVEGIGSSASSLASSTENPLLLSPGSSSIGDPKVPSPDKTLSSSTSLTSSSLTSSSTMTSSSPTAARPGKVVKNETVAPDPNSALITVQMKISRIFQRFLVRCPHAFIAMAGVFFTLYYGFGNEGMAYSATTFVGVGGMVYCLTRAIFLEVIPNWMLPKNGDTRTWRHLMNITYTAFITVIFTSAVWRLQDLSAAQGFFFLTVSFGVPYPLLAKFYPDIDKQPSYTQQKYG